MSNTNVRSAGFWNYDKSLLVRLEDEPPFTNNRQLLPHMNYYKHDVLNCELDYQRVLFSIPFRGLQDKTQVFPLDKENFVRSRLTHSFEVSLNASQIFEELMHNAADELQPEELNSGDIECIRCAIMAASLLHDCGNPPFGHHGEGIIRAWFCEHHKSKGRSASEGCNFYTDLEKYEGNANSLRMAIKGCGLYDGRRINPTSLTLSAMIKYPWYSVDSGDDCKFNFFYSDKKAIDRLIEKCKEHVDLGKKNRSRLSYVMEISDDISYATSDFEDAFRKGKFSVSEVIRFLINKWSLKRQEWCCSHDCDCNTSFNTAKNDKEKFYLNAFEKSFVLIVLLALIAGEEEDIRYVFEYIENNPLWSTEWIIDSNGNIRSDIANYILEDAKKEDGSYVGKHCFSNALLEHRNCEFDSYQKRQLQQTYVSRWVDVVRKWLVFSASAAISKLEKEKINLRNSNYWMFGTHDVTVQLLKKTLEYYVYDDPENLKQNAHAQTVLSGLLDTFIPPVEKCACTSTSDKPSDIQLINPKTLSSTDASVVNLIPMRYRLDYAERYEPSWSEDRQIYELDMMVLDFITSLSDDYAIKLYEELRG